MANATAGSVPVFELMGVLDGSHTMIGHTFTGLGSSAYAIGGYGRICDVEPFDARKPIVVAAFDARTCVVAEFGNSFSL
jgi:hypothetical protein